MSDKDEIVPFTKEMSEKLVLLQKETGWGSRTLHNYGVKNDLGEVFDQTTWGTIENWRRGDVKTLNINHYQKIIETYESLPRSLWKTSTWEAGRIAIDDALKEKINFIIEKTPNIQLRLKYLNAPKTLTSSSLRSSSEGKKKSLKKEEIEFLEYLYQLIVNQNK